MPPVGAQPVPHFAKPIDKTLVVPEEPDLSAHDEFQNTDILTDLESEISTRAASIGIQGLDEEIERLSIELEPTKLTSPTQYAVAMSYALISHVTNHMEAIIASSRINQTEYSKGSLLKAAGYKFQASVDTNDFPELESYFGYKKNQTKRFPIIHDFKLPDRDDIRERGYAGLILQLWHYSCIKAYGSCVFLSRNVKQDNAFTFWEHYRYKPVVSKGYSIRTDQPSKSYAYLMAKVVDCDELGLTA